MNTMIKTLQKAMISIMIIAVIIVKIPALIANAETLSDDNSVFKYGCSNGRYSVSLTNLGADRYAQLNIYKYDNLTGAFVDSIGQEGILRKGATWSCSGYITSKDYFIINAVIYNGTSSLTTPLSTWKTSLGDT